MHKVDTDPEGHLAALSPDVQPTMRELDRMITEAFAGRGRRLWVGKFWGGTDQTIIGYGDLTQPRPRGPAVEWFAVGLARQSRTYSVYVNAVADGAYLLASYADRLGRVKVGSVSISFTELDHLDLAVLGEVLAQAATLTAE